MTAPVAPWTLSGETVAGMARIDGDVGGLPAGIRRLPGRALVMASCFSGTPIGPYLELSVAVPARLGPRPGWCFVATAVDAPEARTAGRDNWGFTKELGRLRWTAYGDERELRWLDRDITVRGVPGRAVVPFLVSLRAVQRRTDGPVVVPTRLRGLARLARLHVSAPPGDPLVGISGEHPGVVARSLRLIVHPARHPVGFRSTLLAPLRAPEPALSGPALSSPTPGD